jgi:hypothetical protein
LLRGKQGNMGRTDRKQTIRDDARNIIELLLKFWRIMDSQTMDIQNLISVVGCKTLA